MDRAELLDRLAQETFDLLVVGGGASGAGVALEAALRGLRVALVERYDFAEGTSSRSTKLIHGGVRYLELAVKTLDPVQLNLVRDALRERAILLRLAPHLARPLWLLTPLYRPLELPYYYLGLKLYDLLAGKARLAPARLTPRREALELFPALNPVGLKGAVAYQDGQFDDARYNLELALTALAHGAVVLNHARVTGLVKVGGRLAGAVVQDRLGGREVEVMARGVVNATGPFADALRRMDDPEAPPIIAPSSGVHLVLDGKYTPPQTGLLVPRTEDGRVLFVLPWRGATLVGTTDNPSALHDHPPVSEEEVGYILRQVRPYLGEIPRSAVRAAWSGLRPLVARGAADTARLARDHLIEERPSGLISLVGGKWTTYRKMAQDLVDYAVGRLGLQAGPSRSAETPLVGGQGFDPEGARRLEEIGLPPQVAQHLHQAYGARAPQVAQLALEGYGAPLVEGWPYLEAEVVYAARFEMAQTPLDVLARRTRLAFLDTQAALAALARVGELLGKELGWTQEERQRRMEEGRDQLLTAL
ncbi:MAG: FAD-dependent oxidoreductase [Meiothermus sp.]|uniref:glycerol-3-phosphate dehydrogenase/oxidase n=1 Tax=Meiothermus sp. TaxID=1955249 RepID=UPI002617A032|nr:FAD-dependent oxidoreductase [Meiothermus sp.]MCS7058968.1 FAD-dependent oxidoreductase [Meiothermus sp.]MDW8480323.1 FAD-dependent oxidoreductase [Meiothermus sp.]